MKKNIFKNRETQVGLGIVSFFTLWGIAWMVYSLFSQGSFFFTPLMNIKEELALPFTSNYFLGTDIYGRSVFQLISAGLLYTLGVSLVVSFCSALIGTMIGYLAVVGGKRLSLFFDLITNVVFIFPNILIAILIMSLTGTSVLGLILALIVTGWAGYSKVVQAETRRLLGLEYVEASRAVGANSFYLFIRVLLPGLLPQVLIHFVLGLSGIILTEATLGFIGLGGSEYSWGVLISIGKQVLLEAPFLIAVLSITLAVFIIGINLLGDGLRDSLDPKNS